MDSFIRSDQYNLIKAQAHRLIRSHSSVNDSSVMEAVKSVSLEKVLQSFSSLSPEEKELIDHISVIEDQEDAILLLSRLKQYVIEFPDLTENHLKKLFPKVKKLQHPDLDEIDKKATSYLGWNDYGSNRKYLVVPFQGELIGLKGTFTQSNTKGICTICSEQEKVGMFTTTVMNSAQSVVRRGNYICQDSELCNQNLTDLTNLHHFVKLMS
ncbi:FusB/FusC family EF-G-binding protein [Halobacillus salinarum]|uniref:FusB/FusC family EF-G-binding protein n=1 Tax=Halobacillus salinarum TaxID=2932257 RepID=A0ABY4EQ37_9BACI|nr:FusB/FusC family EF-G-binding protein [Halobacillus salinarum]UOQ45978.1 FusB/FusC family EF-G-binding protein [Halobacillus salinarum]